MIVRQLLHRERVVNSVAVLALASGLGRSCSATLLAQEPVVRHLGRVSADAPNSNHAEAWLAVDPTNPGRVVVAALADSGDGTVVYASGDTGNTWRRGAPAGLARRSFPGLDPMVVFDHYGTAYLTTTTPFRVWRSGDGGLTWQGPSLVPGRSFDRQFLAIRAGNHGADTIYAIAKTPIKVFGHLPDDVIAFSRSTDGGESFEPPRLLLPDPDKSVIHTVGGLVVVPNGRILISFMAHDVPVIDLALVKNHVWIVTSDDGGRTFSDPAPAATTVVHGNRGDLLKMGKSLAMAGITMDTATASPFRGRLYLAFITVTESRLQIMAAVSRDTGRTWAPPVRVNDDVGTANHSNPTIAVNDQGIVAVLWNDRRADPNDLCFRATMSASLDGGRTFQRSVPLAATGTCPLGRSPTPNPDLDSFRGRYVNGGETQGFAPLPGGRFLAVIVTDRDGVMQLDTVSIEVPGGPARH